MRLLCIGDVCGFIGCEEIRHRLPELKSKLHIDMVIINGENSADGNGITPYSADYLFACGADVITGGNHSLKRSEILPYLERMPYLLRPQNITDCEYGSGYCLVDMGRFSVAVINILGNAFLDNINSKNAFLTADTLVEKAKSDGADVIVIDFHAEATGEKKALGVYLDGRVSAFFGTHTHIQTADECILPKGSGYITDIGMTGPKNSVLGVKSEIIIGRLKSGERGKFELAEGECQLNGCLFDIDLKSGKTTCIERIFL